MFSLTLSDLEAFYDKLTKMYTLDWNIASDRHNDKAGAHDKSGFIPHFISPYR